MRFERKRLARKKSACRYERKARESDIDTGVRRLAYAREARDVDRLRWADEAA